MSCTDRMWWIIGTMVMAVSLLQVVPTDDPSDGWGSPFYEISPMRSSSTRGSIPDLNDWSTLSPITPERSFASVGAWQDFFCVFGGEGGPIVTSCYHPANRTWRQGKSMDVAERRILAASATVGAQAVLVGGDSQGGVPPHTLSYDSMNDTWRQLPPIPINTSALAAAAVGSDVYAIGGADPFTWSPTRAEVFRLNMTTETWTAALPMPTARLGLGAVAIGGKIYVAGGIVDGNIYGNKTSVLEEFDPGTGTWTEKAPMPTKRALFATAVIDGRFLVIGGVGGDENFPLSSIEVYNPATDTWSSGGRMPTPRYGCVAAVVNGTLHVLGGASVGYDANDALNLGQSAWVRRKPMPRLSADSGAVAIDDKIIVMHAYNTPTYVMEYDSGSDTWRWRAPMPGHRTSFGVAELNGEVYVVGGKNWSLHVRTVDVYNVTTDSWRITTPIPMNATEAVAIALNKTIFAALYDEVQGIIVLQSYDPGTAQWSSLGPIPHRTGRGFAVVSLNESLYFVGGRGLTSGCPIREVDAYNPGNGTWWTATLIPTPREEASAVVRDGKMYVLGGANRSAPWPASLDLVEVFDPQSGTWSAGPSMLAPRETFATVVVNHTIHVLGGLYMDSRAMGILGMNEATSMSFGNEPLHVARFTLVVSPTRLLSRLEDPFNLTVHFNNTGNLAASNVSLRRTFSTAVEVVNESSSIGNGSKDGQDTWVFPFVNPGAHRLNIALRPSNGNATSQLTVSFTLEYRPNAGLARQTVTAVAVVEFLPAEPSGTLNSDETLLIAAAATVGVSVTMLGVGSQLNESFRFHLAGFFAALATKLRREELFDNEKRGMIRGYLAANPGANFVSIKNDLRLANGTLVYHLQVMEREGLIKEWLDGRFRRFALSDYSEKSAQPKLTDIELILLQHLRNQPGMTQVDLAKCAGLSQSTVSYHLKKLSMLGLVEGARSGLRKHYTAMLGNDHEGGSNPIVNG